MGNGELAVKVRTEAEKRAIIDQLERMLATSHFSHSKRYPALLRYVVEQSLAGNSDQIKERTLGIEVFGRAPDYDTTQDPVVRTAAGEIRKRIAQYYHEQEHGSELRIELPSGTYVPEFHSAPEPPSTPTALPAITKLVPPIVEMPRKTPVWVRFAWTLPVVAVCVGALLLVWLNPWAAPPAINRFWAPVFQSPNPALLCVGQPHFSVFHGALMPVTAQASREDPPSPPENQVSLDDLYLRGKLYITLWDAMTVSRLSAWMEANSKKYKIRGEISTSLADLREGPAVLIGGFNNDWTLRLTGPLRYIFVNSEPHLYSIRDTQNPSNSWTVDTRIPYLKQTDDYAVISRIKDPTTDRVVVVGAGIAYWGTIAAGEFLTDPKHMEELAKSAGAGWEHKNMQIVLGTKVIQGNSAPPHILATYFW